MSWEKPNEFPSLTVVLCITKAEELILSTTWCLIYSYLFIVTLFFCLFVCQALPVNAVQQDGTNTSAPLKSMSTNTTEGQRDSLSVQATPSLNLLFLFCKHGHRALWAKNEKETCWMKGRKTIDCDVITYWNDSELIF